MPDFQIEINRQALSDARGRLLEAAHAAIERLLSLCTQTDNQDISLQAAKSLLNHCRIVPDGSSLGIEAVTGATPPKLSSDEIAIVQALEDIRAGMYSAHPFVTFMQTHGNLDNEDIDLFLGDFDFLRQEIQEYQARQP